MRRKRIAYGRWEDARVSSAPVVAHIAALHAAGMSYREIGEAAGLSKDAMWKMRRHPYVTKSTADLILRVRFTKLPIDRSQVDATGTRRRLQAMVRMGWTGEEIMTRLGMPPSYSTKLMTNRLVFESTRAAVAALYDELWAMTPPDTYGSRRARTRALRSGWAGPLDWDDIDTDPEPRRTVGEDEATYIDDVAVARALTGEPIRLTRPERVEATRIGHARKWSDMLIASRIGVDAKTVSVYRSELGLPAWSIEESISRTEAAAA